MHTTTSRSITLVWLSVLILSGCSSSRDHWNEAAPKNDEAVASPCKPDPETRVIEEDWPDGSLKLRRNVIDAPDGSLIDHGTYTKWHTNGQKAYEATYVNGKLQGVETSWHKNGERCAEAHYDHGLRQGTLRSWDMQGRLRKEENYASDKPHGTWTIWTADGKVEWQARFDHGAVLP